MRFKVLMKVDFRTPGRADEGRDLVFVDFHVDAFEGLEITVVEVKVLNVDFDGHGGS
jgi:hypothetical protein